MRSSDGIHLRLDLDRPGGDVADEDEAADGNAVTLTMLRGQARCQQCIEDAALPADADRLLAADELDDRHHLQPGAPWL